jgi:lysophospholipase L1-like esterase
VPSDGSFTYVALGDSTGVGVGASHGGGYPDRLLRRLLAIHPGARLVNLCDSGARTADVREDQVPRALRTSPRLLTLGVGINDVGLYNPEEAFAVNFEEIAAPLATLGAPVVVANIPDLALAPVAALVDRSRYERRIEVFNEHIEATAARHRFHLVDLFAASQRLRGKPGLFSPDGFHPSAAGYEEWAEAMWPIVEALVSEGRSVSA